MSKAAKTMLFVTLCLGAFFSSLPPTLFAEVAHPVAAAVVGENIWVTDTGDHKLLRLRASDGRLIESFPISSPLRVIYDGKNVWTGSVTGLVTKINAKDGGVIESYPTGSPASGITFDGQNVWVSNIESNKVTKLRAIDGSNAGSYKVGKAPDGLLFDGEFIWVANSGTNTVTKIKAGDGSTA